MPTYASTASFDLAIDEIIEEAFERCGLQDRTGYEIRTARRSLNILFADWANRGLNLWTIQKQSIAVTSSGFTNPLENATLLTGGDTQTIIDITDAVMRDSSNNDFAMTRIGRGTYWDYTVKSTQGRPTQYYFERTIKPTVYLYPVPDVDYTFVYYALIRMFDAGAYTNNAQIPFRFIPCMVAGLAYYMALKYQPDRVAILKAMYEEEFALAASADVEKATYKIVPREDWIM
jgi:hypothetical protein